MSEVENVFLGADVSLRQVVDEWVGSLLELESMPDGLASEDEIGLRGRATGADGWLVLSVHHLDILVAAHLPGVGTQYFAEAVTVDASDQDRWRSWVRS